MRVFPNENSLLINTPIVYSQIPLTRTLKGVKGVGGGGESVRCINGVSVIRGSFLYVMKVKNTLFILTKY